MTATLKLTKAELEEFVNGNLPERFVEVFDDIPMYHPDHEPVKGETHRQYVEDDGREYRWYIFKDSKTDIEYCLNYTYNSDWPNDIMDIPSSIAIVTNAVDSDIYEAPAPVIVAEAILTPEQQADKDLWAQYQAVLTECKVVDKKEKLKVPKSKITEILNFLKTQHFSLYQLRAQIIPVCIEYKLEQKSFWQWLQVKNGAWK